MIVSNIKLRYLMPPMAIPCSCHRYMVQTKKIPQIDDLREKSGISNQSRTGVDGMRTRCPRPLDDGDTIKTDAILYTAFRILQIKRAILSIPLQRTGGLRHLLRGLLRRHRAGEQILRRVRMLDAEAGGQELVVVGLQRIRLVQKLQRQPRRRGQQFLLLRRRLHGGNAADLAPIGDDLPIRQGFKEFHRKLRLLAGA